MAGFREGLFFFDYFLFFLWYALFVQDDRAGNVAGNLVADSGGGAYREFADHQLVLVKASREFIWKFGHKIFGQVFYLFRLNFSQILVPRLCVWFVSLALFA